MIHNKRDLGGLKTTDGKTIRPGMIIRSAQLAQAEEGDLAGIATIIDLRTLAEQSEMPDRPWGREYLPLPIFAKVNEGIEGVSHEEETEQKQKRYSLLKQPEQILLQREPMQLRQSSLQKRLRQLNQNSQQKRLLQERWLVEQHL